MDFNPYATTEAVKAVVQAMLKVANETKAKKEVGHARYHKMLSTVSASTSVERLPCLSPTCSPRCSCLMLFTGGPCHATNVALGCQASAG